MLAGIITTLLVLAVVTSVLVPPLLPSLTVGQPPRRLAPPRLATTRAARERLLARQRLFSWLRLHPAPPSRRAEVLPRAVGSRPLAPHRLGGPIVAGFFVN